MSLDYPTDEKYVLYADKRKSLSGLNKRMLFIFAPMILLGFLLSHTFGHGFTVPVRSHISPYPIRQVPMPFGPITTAVFSWFPWLLVVEGVLLYAGMARSLSKQDKPIVTLSADGIQVDTTATHLGLIRWDEIQEVRCYTMIYRHVGIVPKNYAALCQRLGTRRAWLVNLNAMCVPLYKPFGLFVAPINIPQVHLSITADELTARIHAYQARYSQRHPYVLPAGTPSAGTDVWPPPPIEVTP